MRNVKRGSFGVVWFGADISTRGRKGGGGGMDRLSSTRLRLSSVLRVAKVYTFVLESKNIYIFFF